MATRLKLAVCVLFLPAVFTTGAFAAEKPVVVPFDFESKFDDGRYGRMVGEMIHTKLAKQGRFLLPETMLDVRDACKSNNLHPAGGTSLEKLGPLVRDEFGANIAIFGSVERVEGHDWDVYDVTIKCVDFTDKDKPKVIYQRKDFRTKTVSEIPHKLVKEMLDAMLDRSPADTIPVDDSIERNWKENPNLVKGDFETGRDGLPDGWDKVAGQQRKPLGDEVRWMKETGNKENRVIRFTLSKSVGDTTGVMYYSDFFPVEEGAKYRFQCRWRTSGPDVKVFIKCYDFVDGEYRKPSEDSSSPGEKQTREVYRSQQNLKGDRNEWHTHSGDFTPRHTKYEPRLGRVMLYAYIGAGVVEFDDVVVKQIAPASPGDTSGPKRHSMESGVTVEEMKDNQR